MSGYRCIPSTDRRFAVSLDNGQEKVVDYQTHGRSEEWKQNVIRNFAQKTLRLAIVPQTSHVLHSRFLAKGLYRIRDLSFMSDNSIGERMDQYITKVLVSMFPKYW